MSTEVLDDNKNVNSPHGARLSGELRAIRASTLQSERGPAPKASDNHIDYIVEQAKQWRQRELKTRPDADIGAWLQMFRDEKRIPFSFQSIAESKRQINARLKANGRRWVESDRRRDIEGRPQKARDILAQMLHRTEVARSNKDIHSETADAFGEFLANGMSLGKNTNLSQFDPYYGSLYTTYPDYQQKVSTEEGRAKFLENREKTRAFLLEKAKQSGQKLWLSDFNHFNNDKAIGVTDRVYIALDPFGEPAEALRAWWQALETVGLEKSLYFKVYGGVNNRMDTLVVYPSDNIDKAKLLTALETFQKTVPPNAILEHAVDTGIELGRGMSYATEDEDLMMVHKLLDSDNERTSYGKLLAGLSATAMQLGYKKVAERVGTGNKKISFTEVARESKQYLRELFVLAGINPETLVSWSRGGQLPRWAQQLRQNNI